jgi:predicted CopG family antitoxin
MPLQIKIKKRCNKKDVFFVSLKKRDGLSQYNEVMKIFKCCQSVSCYVLGAWIAMLLVMVCTNVYAQQNAVKQGTRSLSNVTRTLTAQARVEQFTNVLPRYVMAYVVYRINVKPKKK